MVVVGNDCNQYLLYKTEKANTKASLIFSKKDRAVFETPLTISGEEYYLEAVVEIDKDKNSFYLHEVALINKKEDETLFKTGNSQKTTPSNASSSLYSLLNKLQNVNKNSNDVKYSHDDLQEEKYSRDVDYVEYSQLKRENKHLKEVNELLKHQFELTNGREVSTNALLAAGRNIIKLTHGNA